MLPSETATGDRGATAAPGPPGSGGDTVTANAPATLAERIEQLFQTVHPGRRKPYSIREVADEINAAAGEQVISHSYLWALRKGRKTNPSMIQIAALAGFFRISPLYFFDAPGEQPLDPATRLALSDLRGREQPDPSPSAPALFALHNLYSHENYTCHM